MRGDLTTVDRVKAWLYGGQAPAASTANDALMATLITSASRVILNYMNRANLDVASYSEAYDTGGNNWLVLRQFPVLSVSAVSYSGQRVTQPATGNPPANGFRLDESWSGGQQRLEVYGYPFPRGRAGAFVEYSAGYLARDEAYTVPAASAYIVTVAQMWLSDQGVRVEGGAALAPVAGTPGAGEYSVSEGVYTFSAAQAGDVALVSYGYVPAPIEQAVTEMVGGRMKYRERIGMRSKTLPNGESVTFESRAISDTMKVALANYMRTVPS